MIGLVNREWEGDLKKVGDTVQVRTLGSVTMGPYTKGTPINYQNLAPVKEPLTISDSQYFAFQVEDVDEAQTDMDTLNAYTKRAAIELSNVIERKCLSQYANAHASNKITGDGGAAITLTKDNIYDNFIEAGIRLSEKNVPLSGRWAVVDPRTAGLILKAPELIKATVLGDSVVTNGVIGGAQSTAAPKAGFLGKFAGFDTYQSTQVPAAGGAKYLQFGDPYAIAYAAQLNEVERLRLQDQFAWAVRGLLLHDAKVFAENSKRLATIKAAQ
jgi:hypothetical protein